jgi:hypothetical protein
VPPTIVPARPVAGGPLAARWLWYDLPPLRAGATAHGRAELENAGSAPWRPFPDEQVSVSYHWLDSLGNPIVWAGIFSPVEREVAPGDRIEAWFAVAAPIPPGSYRLSLDLVAEGRCWFSELGNSPLELDVDVAPRIERRALAVDLQPGSAALAALTHAALVAQEEPIAEGGAWEAIAHLAPGCLPAPDWSRRILDAHAEGYAAVGGSIEPAGNVLARRRWAAALAPWAPGGGRNPSFEHPLVCPSVVAGFPPTWADPLAGLPALERPEDEPWLFDGRIRMKMAVEGASR